MLSIDGYISLRGMTNRVKLFIATEFIRGRDESQLFDWPGVWPFYQLRDVRITSNEVADNFEAMAQNMTLRTLKNEGAILRILTPRGDLVKLSAAKIDSDFWPVFARNNNPGFDPDWYANRSFDSFRDDYWKQQFLEYRMFKREAGLNDCVNWQYGAVDVPDDAFDGEDRADRMKKLMLRPYNGCPIMVDEVMVKNIPLVRGSSDNLAEKMDATDIKAVAEKIINVHDTNPSLTKKSIKEIVAPSMSDYTFEFHWKVAVDSRPALGRRGRR